MSMRPCLLFLIVVGLLLPACGKKSWPVPQKAEDRFAFENVQGSSDGGCLRATFNVSGGSQYLTGLALLVEQPDTACDKCPFRATERIDLSLTDPRVRLYPDAVAINHCGLDPSKRYRFRLVGSSSLRAMPLVSSPVLP